MSRGLPPFFVTYISTIIPHNNLTPGLVQVDLLSGEQGKSFGVKDENQQQTQPTCVVRSQTWAALCHTCVITNATNQLTAIS